MFAEFMQTYGLSLIGASGILDLRTGKVHSEVVVEARKERFFANAN